MSDAPKQSPLAAPEPWNLVADAYTEELLPMFELFATDALALARVPAAGKVLDVATGPGTLALLAARAGASVTAIDFSTQMVERARRRLAAAGATADVRLGDGQALPFEDSSFDAAFSMFGLMFFPERSKGFAELHRVLVPGGRAVVSSWAPFEGLFATMMRALKQVLPDIAFGDGKGPLGDPAEFAQELRAAGFREVSVTPQPHTVSVASPAAFFSQCERTSAPLVLLKNRLGDSEWQRVTRGVLGTLQQAHGTGEVEMVTTAYLGHGVKA